MFYVEDDPLYPVFTISNFAMGDDGVMVDIPEEIVDRYRAAVAEFNSVRMEVYRLWIHAWREAKIRSGE